MTADNEVLRVITGTYGPLRAHYEPITGYGPTSHRHRNMDMDMHMHTLNLHILIYTPSHYNLIDLIKRKSIDLEGDISCALNIAILPSFQTKP